VSFDCILRILERSVHHIGGYAPMPRGFGVAIHKAFGSAASPSDARSKKDPAMNISSVAAPTQVTSKAASVDTSASKAPDATDNSPNDDAGAAQPAVVAALPPGQGTRIDQLV
jgi:hypothetical protein